MRAAGVAAEADCEAEKRHQLHEAAPASAAAKAGCMPTEVASAASANAAEEHCKAGEKHQGARGSTSRSSKGRLQGSRGGKSCSSSSSGNGGRLPGSKAAAAVEQQRRQAAWQPRRQELQQRQSGATRNGQQNQSGKRAEAAFQLVHSCGSPSCASRLKWMGELRGGTGSGAQAYGRQCRRLMGRPLC